MKARKSDPRASVLWKGPLETIQASPTISLVQARAAIEPKGRALSSAASEKLLGAIGEWKPYKLGKFLIEDEVHEGPNGSHFVFRPSRKDNTSHRVFHLEHGKLRPLDATHLHSPF